MCRLRVRVYDFCRLTLFPLTMPRQTMRHYYCFWPRPHHRRCDLAGRQLSRSREREGCERAQRDELDEEGRDPARGPDHSTIPTRLCCTAEFKDAFRIPLDPSRDAVAVGQPEMHHCVENPAGDSRLRWLTCDGAASKTATDYHFKARLSPPRRSGRNSRTGRPDGVAEGIAVHIARSDVTGYRMAAPSGMHFGFERFGGEVLEPHVIYKGVITNYEEEATSILRPFFDMVWEVLVTYETREN